jgi:hypothetical protein
MRVTLEVEISEQGLPHGSLRTEADEERRFEGWLELITLLHAAVEQPVTEGQP